MIRGKRCSIFWAIGERRRRRINHSWEHSHVCPKLFWVVLSSIRDKVLLAQRLSQALFISKFSRICVNESTCQKPRVSTHTRLCHRWEQRSPRISKESKEKGLESTHPCYSFKWETEPVVICHAFQPAHWLSLLVFLKPIECCATTVAARA